MNKLSNSKRKLSVIFSIVLLCSLFVIYSTSLAVAKSPGSPNLGSNAVTTLGYKILFDESKEPLYGISNESVAFETADAYSKLRDRLIIQGYTIDTLNENDTVSSAALEGYDLLVIVAPVGFYTTVEIEAIYNWTMAGNSLLLISDWGSFLGNSTNTIANEFGYEFAEDYIEDSDDYFSMTYWFTLNESNIKPHAITAAVLGIEIYLGDGIIADPIGAIDIITTDIDDTAEWNSGGYANNVPIISAVDDYMGTGARIVVVSESNLWTNQDTDGDGTLNIDELNNSFLALNVIKWLSPITQITPLQGIYFSFIAVFVILISFIRIKTKKR